MSLFCFFLQGYMKDSLGWVLLQSAIAAYLASLAGVREDRLAPLRIELALDVMSRAGEFSIWSTRGDMNQDTKECSTYNA